MRSAHADLKNTLIFLFSAAAIDVAVVFSFILDSRNGIGKEFTHREIELSEDIARVVVSARCAILFGNTITAAVDKDRDLALKPYNREHTDADEKAVASDTVNERDAEAFNDVFGDAVDAAAAIAERTVALDYLCVKANGLRDLNDRHGQGRLVATFEFLVRWAEGVLLGVGPEDRNVLFASEKDYLLIVDRKPADLPRNSVEDATFQRHAEEEADVDLIEPLVERNGFKIDVRCDDLDAFRSDIRSVVEYLLRLRAKIDAKILKAFFIACAVEDLTNVDAALLVSSAASELAFIYHCFTSIIIKATDRVL